ncbi:hypothetical protein KVT40_001839 [Elsinoe batatas]|uniref:Maltose/galactoside acetyltransferase domain-containing protein n=1 Tax=Elsinoe batatas TaxID=2601811 RepID=A0A8K0L9Y5_9PEZI|nr:hypothetical protein KVT40_001839 [Elsinoe batatas]
MDSCSGNNAPWPSKGPVEPGQSYAWLQDLVGSPDLGRTAASAGKNLLIAAYIRPAITTAGAMAAPLRAARHTDSHSKSDERQWNSDRARGRNRMLVGLPYLHYCDPQLIDDRKERRAALERYNNATRPSVGTSDKKCERLFRSIVVPRLRPNHLGNERPIGSLGRYAVCTMQDAAKIRVGHRSTSGPNVRFYTMTLPTDRRARGGSRSLAMAAPITLGEDCLIEADVLILAGRSIGRGSIVGAGTIVSKDIPDNCVVAGSPPKILCFTLSPPGGYEGSHS